MVRLPWWGVTLIVLSISGLVLPLYLATEGRLFLKSRAAIPGDLFLAAYCGIIAWMSKDGVPSGIHTNHVWHLIVALLSLSIGLLLFGLSVKSGKRWGTIPANLYHNLAVVPILGYIIVSTLPLLFYFEELEIWKAAASSCISVWLSLLFWDLWNDNLDQSDD